MLQVEGFSDENPTSDATSERSGFGENFRADRIAEVRAFLGTLHLEQHLDSFITNGWTNMEDVLEMQERHLIGLGLVPGHVARLQRAIKKRQRVLEAEIGDGEHFAREGRRRLAEVFTAVAKKKAQMRFLAVPFLMLIAYVFLMGRTASGWNHEASPAVMTFLSNLKLESYSEQFGQHGFDDLEDVLDMQERHMREMGMVNGHIVRLTRGIATERKKHRPEEVAQPRAASPGRERVDADTDHRTAAPRQMSQSSTVFLEPNANDHFYEEAPRQSSLKATRANRASSSTSAKTGSQEQSPKLSEDAQQPSKQERVTEEGSQTAGENTVDQEEQAMGPVEWNQAFLRACASGDLNTVNIAVEGIPPKATCGAVEVDTLRSGLHLAAEYGHPNIIKSLFEVGPACPSLNAEALDRLGRTPLHLASLKGHSSCVEALLEGGAKLDAVDPNGRTSLHLAASNGQMETMDVLIKAGLQLGTRDELHRTAVHYAALHGHPKCIKYSMEGGAAMDAVDSEGRTSLHLAASEGQTNAAEHLLQVGLQPEATDQKSRTPLHHAAMAGQLETVNFLVKKAYSNINAVDENKQSALHLATSRGYTDLAKDLIEAGCDVELTDKDGKTALHVAVFGGFPAIVDLLIQEANLNVFDSPDLITPFMLAARSGNLEIAKKFVASASCSKEARNKAGRTALHEAAANGQTKMVDYLVAEARMNLATVDNEGKTPCLVAAQYGELDVIKFLASRADCDKGARDNNGQTAFLIAAEHGHYDTVKFLASRADTDKHAKNKSSWTALHLAAGRGHLEVVKYMVEQVRIPVNEGNESKWTPRDAARWAGHTAVDEYLRSKGGWRCASGGCYTD